MPDINWNNPCPHWEVAVAERAVADEERRSIVVEHQRLRGENDRLREVEAAHLASSAEDADRIADLESRFDTSLEVIRSREQHVEAQRKEIERLRGGIKDVVAERDEARLLAGALLDRVTEVEEILGCRKDAWKSSLVAKWPWLEDKVAENAGGE